MAINKTVRRAFSLALPWVLFLAVSCGKFKPDTSANAFISRAQTKSEGPLHVSVSALGGKESHQYFGVKLAKKEVQPVWLKVRNDSNKPYWLLPISVDPSYFSPNEAAYRSHRGKSKKAKEEMDHFFDAEQIQFFVPPGQTEEGFLYTNRDIGSKEISVELLGPGELKRLNFVVPVPGLKADYENVDFEHLYPPEEIRNVDLDGLRRGLEVMPGHTIDKKAKKEEKGDAVNLVIVADIQEMITAFVRRGWKETVAQDKRSSLAMVKHTLFGGSYSNAPMSKLWLFGRSQDISFQKPRATVRQRNHLRLWMTSLKFKNKPVWVGTISRDIGLRASVKAPLFITHKIDSDVDESRDFLMQDLLFSESVDYFGYVKGVGQTPYDQPRENLMNDKWFTDGLRMVAILTHFPTPILKAKFLNWEESTNLYNPFNKALVPPEK